MSTLSTESPKKSLGDLLAGGVESIPPDQALQAALRLSHCVLLPHSRQALEIRATVGGGDRIQQQIKRDREKLDVLERDCQTVPAETLTLGPEAVVRAKLLVRAYDAGVAGAAAELLKLPPQLLPVPASKLLESAILDGRSGDLRTMADLLLNAETLGVEPQELKLYAFALQRGVRNAELRELVEPTQILYSKVLEERWQRASQGMPAKRPLGFNTDAQGVFLYPQGFDEPHDERYLARAQALDAALLRAARQGRKPS